MKFLIRKLIFVGVLAALIAVPFAYTEYKSITTANPYILVAREVEAYGHSVDALGIEDHPGRPEILAVIIYIPEYPSWSVRQDRPNFNAVVLRAVARQGYTGALIVIGWDFPPPDFLVQGLFMCEELRRSSCVWENVSSMMSLPAELLAWPGIGNP